MVKGVDQMRVTPETLKHLGDWSICQKYHQNVNTIRLSSNMPDEWRARAPSHLSIKRGEFT